MSDSGNLDYAANYYQRWLGLTPEQARGAARYMWRNESGLDPGAVNPTSGALGIGQWLGPRKRSLQDQYGTNPTFDQQLEFSSKELAGPQNATLAKLRQAKTEKQAYDIWGSSYERPGTAALAKAGVLKPEGYYQGPGESGPAQHINIQNEPLESGRQLLDLIIANRLGQQDKPQEQDSEAPSTAQALLSHIMGQSQQVPQEEQKPPEITAPLPAEPAPQMFSEAGKAPLASVTQGAAPLPQAPDLAQPRAPAQQQVAPPKSAKDLLTSIFSAINPVGTAQAAPAPLVPQSKPGPQQPQPRAMPPVVEPGQQTPAEPQSKIAQFGEALASTPKELLDIIARPFMEAGETTQRVMSGQGFSPQEALGAALTGVGGSVVGMGRGGLGAGPRLPPRVEPPPIGAPRPTTGGAPPSGDPPRVTPATPASPTPPPGKFSAVVKKFTDTVKAAVRDAQIKAVPMAAGDPAGQAIAKDFATAERLARFRRSRWDQELVKIMRKDPVAGKRIWEAMDNASVAAQTNGVDAGKRFIDALVPRERRIVLEMEQHGTELWEQARDAGLVEETAERLPFYVPRAIVDISGDRPFVPPSKGPGSMANLNQPAVNLRTQGPMRREHLTVEQTEAGAQYKYGPGAQVVRDIRVLPLAYEKFERSIAGRRMINDLKAVGMATGKPVVAEGAKPPGNDWFTLPHPAFRVYQADGASRPIYVAREFEGPLRAITRTGDGILYRGAMMAKGGAMSLIMNSPLIHNAVIYGKAFPSMPGKMITFHFYTQGEKLLGNRGLMERAINDGMVPIGQHGYLQDIEGIAEEPAMQPGRSMTAKVLGGATDLVSPKAGQAVRSGIDQAGEFWHYTMLWKQVAKVQVGLYDGFRTNLIKKGIASDAAGKMAAHLANRYAGILPNEAMSQMARKILNVGLFSRSFTVGNLAVFKDAINGLPQDVRAQMGRDLTRIERSAMTNIARRKALAVLATDVALFYGLNAVAESGLSMMRGDTTLDDEMHGYVDRVHRLFDRGKENVLDVLNPFDDMLALSPLSEHEPGKQDRIKIGTAKDGTAIYGRNPLGKFAEEAIGWLQTPLHLLKNKEGTVARPILNILQNDRGFGQAVYSKTATGLGAEARAVGSVVWELLRNQLPENQVKAALDMLQGQGGAISAGQALAPLAGFTVSRGAPGGPQVGEMYAAKGAFSERLKEARPQLKRLIEGGKDDEARALMQSIGTPPPLMKYLFKTYRNPAARLSPKAKRDFERYADPEAKRRMERDLRPNAIGH